MKIRQNFDQGYTKANAYKVIGEIGEVISITSDPVPVYASKDGKTDFTQSIGLKGWFACKTLQEPILVKFPSEVSFPSFGQKCKFKELEACIVKDNCYFRAEDIILRGAIL